ncbi:MAG: RNA methyltransferase, partial [Polyangiales bacterium]
MSAVYCALVHYPVLDRRGEEVATALTNLDVHDLSRASRTYGLSGFYVVTPVEAQQKIVGAITDHWSTGAGKDRVPERTEALALCAPVASIDEAAERIAEREGRAPQRWVTSAREPAGARLIPWAEGRRILADTDVPTLILFGTG